MFQSSDKKTMGPKYSSGKYASKLDTIRTLVPCPNLLIPLTGCLVSTPESLPESSTLAAGQAEDVWVDVPRSSPQELSHGKCRINTPVLTFQVDNTEACDIKFLQNSQGLSPSCPQQQFCSLGHPGLIFLPSLSYFPTHLPEVPEITTQINYLYSHPCLRVYFCRDQD